MSFAPLSSWFRQDLKSLWKLSAVLLLLIQVSCGRGTPKTETAASPTPQPVRRINQNTESSWIVKSIVRDIAEMVAFAGRRDQVPLLADAVSIETLPADGAGYHYKATLKAPVKIALPIDIGGSIWDASVYRATARALLEALQLSGNVDRITIPDTPVKLLAHPLAINIQRENERVSAALTAHPLSPELHEQAALVLGVLGLRENSGELWDTRGMNNRAIAHLALARALRGDQPLSDAGEIAELLPSLEADTKKDSAGRIARLKARSSGKPELAPWITAAQLRNTRDWRILADPARASLLERIEWFRAYGESVSPDVATKQLLDGKPESIPDWANIVLELNFSVEGGHLFAEKALPLTLEEISEVFPESKDLKLSAETLAQILNKEPGSVVSRDAQGHAVLRAIDDGMWAHFYQRHLCHAASRVDYFLRERWSVPDEAQKFEESISSLFSKLTLSPFLHVLWNSAKHTDRTGDEAVAKLVRQHPEWVGENVWHAVDRPETAAALQAWYSPGLPVGTAYRYSGRSECVTQVKRMKSDDLRKLYEIAPLRFEVVRDYMQSLYGEKPKPEQVRDAFAPFFDFKKGALVRYARYAEENPAEYTWAYERAAKMDPECYLKLAGYYHRHQMDEKGVQALEQARTLEADAVALANQCGWVVDYYYDHGQKDRALDLAQFAAEVYSFSGLRTMASLQERMGNAREAESYFEKIKERYDNAGPLTGFYVRQSERQPGSEYATKLRSSISSMFPNGMESVTLQSFAAPPQKGVLVGEENRLLVSSGLRKGDIIVALDGKRVESMPQYTFVRGFTESPKMELIIYQNGQYRLLNVEIPDRKFGVRFRTWP